jgi:PAS domain S-box-containing protein
MWAGLLAFILLFPSFAHAENRILKVGVHDIEPLAFKVGDAMYDGLAINILEHIAKEENLVLEYVQCRFSVCLAMLESGELDIHSVIAYSEERAERFNYTKETLFNDWDLIYTRRGLHAESVADLDGLRVAVMVNTIQYKPFIELVNKFSIEVDIIPVNSFESSFRLLEGKEADALVINRLSALVYEKKYQAERTPIIFNPIDIRYAAPKGSNDDILRHIDEHLRVYKNDKGSLYYESIERLFGVERGERLPYWILSVLAIVAVVAIISLVFVQALRSQVRKRTAELKEELEERKRIEQKVFQGQQDWVETFDTITDIITIHDKDFNIIRANKAASEALDLPWSKINKAKCYEHYHGTDCPPDKCLSCKCLETGEPALVEFYEPHLGKFIELRAIPRKDRDGNIVGLVHVARDITERKQAEEALRLKAQIINQTHDSVITTDLNGNITSWNMGAERLYGYKAEEALGRHISLIYKEDRLDFLKNEVIDPLMDKGVHEVEDECINKSGETVYTHLSLSLIRDDKGQPKEMIGYSVDITERRKAEEALRTSEEKYRSLIKSINSGFALHEIVLDDKGVPVDYVFLETNDIFKEVTGIEQDITGRTVSEVLPGIKDSEFDWIGAYGSVALTGKDITIEHFAATLDRWYSVHAYSPKHGYFATIFSDITERKKAEETLISSEKRFRELFDHTPIAYQSLDEKGRFIDVNEDWLSMTGYEEEDVIGRRFDEFWSEETKHLFPVAFETLKADCVVDKVELTLRKKDGELIEVLLTGRVQSAVDGSFIKTHCIISDITRIKRAEEKYRNLFGNIPLPVFVIDPDTTEILDVNNSAVSSYGYSREELLSMNARQLRPPEDIESFMKAMDDTREGSHMLKGVSHQKKDGTIVDVEVATYDLSFEGRRANLAVVNDVTDSNRALEEMHKAQSLLTAAIVQSPAGIIIAEAPDGMIRVVNSAALDIRGETETDLTNIPIERHPQNWQTFWPDGAPVAPDDLPLSQAILYGNESKNIEFVIRNSRGEDRWVSANAAPIKDPDDRIIAGIVVFHDITEQKMAEEALRESEKNYRTIVDNVQAGIAKTTIQGEYLYANNVLMNLFGYENFDELAKDKALSAYRDPKDRELLIEDLRRDGKVINRAVDIKTRTDSIKTILINSILDGDELTTMFVDITERMRAEEALRASEEKFRRLFDESDDATLLFDPDKGFLDCNDRAAELFGAADKNSLLKKHPSEISPEVQPDNKSSIVKANEMISIALESGSTNFEWLHQRLDGQVFPAEVTMTAIPFEGAMLLHCVLRDITERKRAEESLRQSEEKFSKVFHSSPYAITISTMEEGRFIEVNEGFEVLSGWRREEAIGRTTVELNFWENLEQRDEFVSILKRKGSVRDFEMNSATRLGNTIPVLIQADMVEISSKSYLVTIIRDLSERKRAEQSAHLASIGELAAGVAHEINNPTSSIMLNSRLLMRSTGMKEAEAREIYSRIYEDTERISGIVKSLLSFARPETKMKKKVSVRVLLEDSLRLTGKHLEKNNIRLNLDIEEGLPEIMATPQRIEQVMINIITNAIYALNKKYPGDDEGKKLEITVREVSTEKGSSVRLEFMDSGCGIPQDQLDRIMSPFFTTKPTGEGTGLGLSISHGIIAEHRGTLEIESREGEFTRVQVDLPVGKEA